jgi:hypothetical protein
MKFFLITLCIFSFSLSYSQNSFSEADAKAIINTFFEGFHKGDTLLMKSVISPDLVLQTAYSTNDGKNKVSLNSIEGFIKAIANRPTDQKWDERLLDYKIEIDGNLAHVWTPYEFWLNDTFLHCGANAFTLARFDDGWKIIHLIDSRRKSACHY